ncbi:MAG TPA: hypothetical protein VLE97_03910 [Gaiellaceae bacterium]|nr:hypothetical protein [Gaiellaceae bacterium]
MSAQRYTVELRIVQAGIPHLMTAQSAVAPETVSVHLQLGGFVLADGSVQLGSQTAGLIYGPFLYERVPDGLSLGAIQWVRISIPSLSRSHPALRGMHGLTALPLLHVLGEARARAVTRDASIFRGTVAYDDPIVDNALQLFSAGMQFRGLQITAWIGKDGLVHRIRITGHTPDRTSTMRVDARLFAFGRPVRVTPPAEGTFVDKQLQQLAN